ncbi:MAG: hypothetical protein FWF82_00960 [Oscillospiraceae bacterium]|nr:hypothetical protein [Oscillospiraceae bacterium]
MNKEQGIMNNGTGHEVTAGFSLDLPKQVVQVLDRLYEHGYSAYIFGECVRLFINGQTHLDFDVATDAELSRIRAVFERETADSAAHFYLNEDNIENGILNVTVLGVAISITTFVNLEFELSKRSSFTFNAIAYSHKEGLFDPFGGVAALENGEIRRLVWTAPGKAWSRRDLEHVLMSRYIKEILEEFHDVFSAAVPELKMLSEHSENEQALLHHTFKSVGASAPILTLRYALLFHELGKPDCYSKSWDDKVTYFGHAERAKIYTSRIMTRLGCSSYDIKETEYIIKNYGQILDCVMDGVGKEDFDIRTLSDKYSPNYYPADLLKLLLLFNCAVFRADSDEKNALIFNALSKTKL